MTHMVPAPLWVSGALVLLAVVISLYLKAKAALT